MASQSAKASSTSEKSQTDSPPNVVVARELGEEQQHITGLKLALLLSSLTLVTFLVLLDTSIIGTAIPRITTEFQSLRDVGWYVGAYTLAAATLQPMSGKFYTYFNNKVVYLAFVFTFELGSLICGVSSSSAMFIAGRAIAGLGASGLFNGAITILMQTVPREKCPMYTGILLGLGQIGILAGPLVGGALTEHATWRWCFYMNLPLGGVAAGFVMLIRINEPAGKSRFSLGLVRKMIPDLDLIGFTLFVPASIMLLLALQFGSGDTYAWNSATVIGLLCAAGVMAIIFVFWEMKMGVKAMIPGPLLRQHVVYTSCIHGMCVVCSIMVTSCWLPTYFQAVRGDGPSLSGVHVLPSVLSQLLLVISSGAIVSRTGYYLPWAFGSGIVTAIGNGLLSTLTTSTSVGEWVGYQIVVGAGRGAGMQISVIAVQNAVSAPELPVALAQLIFFQNFGMAIAIVISNTILAQTLTSTVARYAPSVTPQAALDAGSGAAAVRALVPVGQEEQLGGVLKAYAESLRNIFYFLVGTAIISIIMSFGMGWKDIRVKDEGKKVEGNATLEQGVKGKAESTA